MGQEIPVNDSVADFIINGIYQYPDLSRQYLDMELHEDIIDKIRVLLRVHGVEERFTGVMCFFFMVMNDEYRIEYDHALKTGFAGGQRKDFSWRSQVRSELDDLKLLFKQIRHYEDAYREEWKKVDDDNDESQFPKELDIQMTIKTNSDKVLPVKLSYTLSSLILKAIQENDTYKKMQEGYGELPTKFQYNIALYTKRVVSTFHSVVCHFGLFNSKFDAEISAKARRFLIGILEISDFQVDEHTGDLDKYLKDNFHRGRSEGLLRVIG